MPNSLPKTVPTPSPPSKKAAFFFDAQNLYFSAKEAFGASEPNFDPVLLATHFCRQKGWELTRIYFYTGVPGALEQPRWHKYWSAKLRRLRNQNVQVFSVPLRYRPREFELPLSSNVGRSAHLFRPDDSQIPRGPLMEANGDDIPEGSYITVRVAEEKGVDVRLAIDFIRLTLESAFDVAVLFTQDQDQAEAVKEAKKIAASQNRAPRFELYSAFPEGCVNKQGVNGTIPLRISKDIYDACIDPRDYFK